jgi:hypothetical protein
MAKFDSLAQASKTINTKSPIKAKGRTTTHEGGEAYSRTAKSDLFMLAVVNMVGEDTFYESASDRDARFRDLVHRVTKKDPEWMQRFIPWLRNEANMRSASIVAAVEYKAAGGPNPRGVINSAIARADEPAEAIAYAKSRGIAISGGLQRGIADAAKRVYNEYTSQKYDGGTRSYRMGDVLNLVHPKPDSPAQGDLFKYLLDKRHHQDAKPTENLVQLTRRAELDSIPVENRRAALRSEHGRETIRQAGMTWETLSGWLQGPMDAEAWEAIIPTMGYMALLRNLRNFDEAGVSEPVKQKVAAKLSDPEQVAKSRQFPYRFYSAYENAPGMIWGYPLEQALNYSTRNIPEFNGETLILVDTSASMYGSGFSRYSEVTPATAAALFGVSMAIKGNSTRLVGFADDTFEHKIPVGGSVLKGVESFLARIGEVGHGTRIANAVRAQYRAGQTKRIVIVSDMQTFQDYGSYSYNPYAARLYGTPQNTVSELVPTDVPMYGFNLGGYAPTVLESGKNNRHEFGGLNDATFKMLKLIETAKSADWPF